MIGEEFIACRDPGQTVESDECNAIAQRDVISQRSNKRMGYERPGNLDLDQGRPVLLLLKFRLPLESE